MNIHPKTTLFVAVLAGLGATGFLWSASRPNEAFSPALTQGTFQISYESEANASTATMLANTKAGSAPKTSVSAELKSSISGRWVVTTVSEDADGAWVAIHMEGVQSHLTSNGNVLDQRSRSLELDMQKTFFAKVMKNGAVQSVQFGSDWPGDSRDYARTLLGLSQVVVPSSHSLQAGNWSVTQDVHGARNLTEYRVVGNGGSDVTIERKPVSASTDQSSSIISATPANLDGKMTCRLDRDGRLDEIKGQTSSESSFAGSSLGTETVGFEMKRVDSSSQATVVVAALKRRLADYKSQEPSCRLSSLELAPDQKKRYAVQALEGDTEASLLKKVAAEQAKKIDGSHDEAKLAAHLLALFKLKPETCKEFADSLDSCPTENPALYFVVSALGGAGHADAQVALTGMLKKSGNDVNRLRKLVPALVHSSAPTAESEAAVQELLASADADIRGVGYLGLGTMAGNLSKDQPDRAHRLQERLIDALKASQRDSDTAVLILAIGNIGNDRSFEIAKEYLASPSGMLRQCAVASLSKIRTEDVGKILLDRVRNDADYAVRVQAAAQFQFQTMSDALESQILTLLSSLREPGLRVALIQATSGKHVGAKFSAFVRMLEATDSSDEVKRAAKRVEFAN